jgi:hypothetical protein
MDTQSLPRSPRVGDDVLYVARGSADGVYLPEPRAGKITQVGAWVTRSDSSAGNPGEPRKRPEPGDTRTLAQEWMPTAVLVFVMNPTGLFIGHDIPVEYHSGRDVDGEFAGWLGGSWHWPEDEPGWMGR